MRWSLSALWRPRKRLPNRRERESLEGVPHRKVGLALSAGGAKGLAHVGVLQVLEEQGIEVDVIAGCSMGAYVGALWACGYSGPDLEELASEMQDRRMLWKLADPLIPPVKGLFRGEKAKRHLMRSIGNRRIEGLARGLLVVTFDLDTKERLVLREGPIADAVHASCAMPGVVQPVHIGSHRCADGGVVDPLPLSALRKFSDVDVLIGVNALPSLEEVERYAHQPSGSPVGPPRPLRRLGRALNRRVNFLAEGNLIDTLRKSIQAAQLRLAEQAAKRADLCLHPRFDLPGLWHDYQNFRHYIDAGRTAAEENLETIKHLINPKHPLPNEGSPHPLVGERVA